MPLSNDPIILERIPDIRESGYCRICQQRYTDVPVIDRIAACPRCYKLE